MLALLGARRHAVVSCCTAPGARGARKRQPSTAATSSRGTTARATRLAVTPTQPANE